MPKRVAASPDAPRPVRRMTGEEQSLIRRMHFEQGVPPAKTAGFVGRSVTLSSAPTVHRRHCPEQEVRFTYNLWHLSKTRCKTCYKLP